LLVGDLRGDVSEAVLMAAWSISIGIVMGLALRAVVAPTQCDAGIHPKAVVTAPRERCEHSPKTRPRRIEG